MLWEGGLNPFRRNALRLFLLTGFPNMFREQRISNGSLQSVEVGGTRQMLGHSFKSLPHRIFPIDFDPREEKIPEIPTLVQK